MIKCAGEGDQVFLHLDHQQLQLLPRGDGGGAEKLHLLCWRQRQTEMVCALFHASMMPVCIKRTVGCNLNIRTSLLFICRHMDSPVKMMKMQY